MTASTPIVRVVLVIIAGLLSSCIDSREEYWLQADGSGRAEFTYRMPAAVATAHGGDSGIRNMIADFLKQTPELAASHYEVVTEENRVRVTVTAAFDSALALKDIVSRNSHKSLPSAATHLAGIVTADMQWNTLDFSRKISASRALPGSAFLPASKFDGHRVLYIMHLPAVPSESNATRVEDFGRTLVWDIPLAQAVKSPVVIRFKMAVPIPWRLVSAIAIPLLAAACALAFHSRKSRNRFTLGNPGNSVM